MATEVKIIFPFEIGQRVRLKASSQSSFFGIGHVGTITGLVVRVSPDGAVRYCQLKGSTEEIPVLCCEAVEGRS